MKKESKFQSELIKELRDRFPGCIILKNDPNYLQGFPDLLVLWNTCWAALEVKRNANAKHQPNQNWYVDLANCLSFGSFIYPENKEEVLNEMERSFSIQR